MAELRTRPTTASVTAFLDSISHDERRKDCRAMLKIMKDVTKSPPKMWGSSIVGFGRHHYKVESGREGDWFRVGFSPRKGDLTVYLMSGLEPHAALLAKLGRHKTGKGCLYIKRLADVDLDVLTKLIEVSTKRLPARG
jgi:hypothetical protein